MERLRSAKHCRQSLQGHPGYVIERLLRRERHAGGLRVEAHQPGPLLLCAKAVFHQAVPDLARGTELGNLFKEVAVRVEEVAQAWPEIVNVEAATARPLHVLHAVINGKRQFLQRS